MKKMELYAGIMLLTVLLCGCKGQENEIIQDGIETETKETAENTQDNAFTISASELPCAAKEGKTEENEVAWNVERASVSDSNYTVTIGTLLEDFEYPEEDLLGERVDNYCGLVSVNRVWHDLYIRSYTDFAVFTSDYNPATHEISGENKYIVSISLQTSRFYTNRGITVGATLDELRKAYHGAKLIYKEESASGRLIYTYEEGTLKTCFYVDKEQNRVTELTLYVW